jgi:hypothetical protein
MKLLRLLGAALLLASVSLCSAEEGILSYNAQDGGFATGTIGWSFQALTNITLTSLGSFNYITTNSGPIAVGLWAANGTLLASNTISLNSPLQNQSRYESIDPISLTKGSTYYLGAYSLAGGISFVEATPEDGGFVITSSEIQLGSATASTTAGFALPTDLQGGPGSAFLAPNMEFSVVPEPSPLAFLSLGALALAWRKFTR